MFEVTFRTELSKLKTELRVNEELDYSHHVEEKEHQFLKIENTFIERMKFGDIRF